MWGRRIDQSLAFRAVRLTVIGLTVASAISGCSHSWDPTVDGYDLHLKNTGTVAVTIAFCEPVAVHVQLPAVPARGFIEVWLAHFNEFGCVGLGDAH
jgi:hypothetical protein